MFAQHVAHKTVFSLAAWVIYVVLLWGRHRVGWRGYTAIRWTLAGFVLLMLAYFGSKLVLELILIRRRSEEHTSELQSRGHLVCRLLLEKKKTAPNTMTPNKCHSSY